MKKELCCIVTSSLLCACVSATDTGTKIKVAQAYKKEGDVFQTQGNYTAALAKFLEAEKTIPNDPYLQNSLGLAYMGKKRYDLAVDSFTRALTYKKDYTDALNNLGVAYLRQEKWDKAIIQFNRVLEDLIYPTPHFALANIGWAYMGKAHYPNAQTYFLKALEEKSGFITATHGLVQVYLRTGQTDRAVRYLHRTLRRTPDAAILHADLAEAYEKEGLQKQALKEWRLILKLVNQDTALAKKAESRILILSN
ncbi:MAG: tetratricopeptide repeat protein [Desulfobacter sp.]|nr:MAG: tetratricopeptide repeat protein [Desulfobacter sp.]